MRKKRKSKRGTEHESRVQPRAPYILRKLDTFNVLSEEGLSLIEENADRILQDTGMEFLDEDVKLMTHGFASSPVFVDEPSRLPHLPVFTSTPEIQTTRS